MATTHRYQIMPGLSPEEYAALKADIAANGVRIPIDVDEEGNIIDGFHRKQICDELGIECPTRAFFGHTEEEKLEHAWQLNLARRHLTKAQKRMIAGKLWTEGWTQDRIAQALGVGQRTVSRWLRQFSHLAELSRSDAVQGKDGKRYPRVKTPRRAASQTEGANGPHNPLRSDADDGQAHTLEQGDTTRPRDANPETRSPSEELRVASDAPEPLEMPAPITDEFRGAGGEQRPSALSSSPVPPAEDDAEAHWVGALQDLSARLEMLHVQGGLLPPSTRWSPETRARGMATMRHLKEILIELEAVVASEMGEASDRNGQDDVDVTPLPVTPPVADAAQEHGKREIATVSSTEDRV